MAKVAADGAGTTDPQVLAAIADSVRGSFQTVEDMAQSFIREAIHQGAFPPGHRLNLDNIASTLGISRMPVRASLRQLESEGLLRIHPYRGAVVSVLGTEEIAEIYELRILLESYLLELAISNLDDDTLRRLEAIVADLESADELGQGLDLRRTFYQLLYEQARRPRALGQVSHLRGSVGRYLLLKRVGEHGHETLLGFLRDRNAAGAIGWLADHLAGVSRSLQAVVRESNVDPLD